MSAQELGKPGDLLFYKVTKSSGLASRITSFLVKLTGEGSGTYTHVSLVNEDCTYQYEATVPRIGKSSIDWAYPGLELFRIKDLNETQALAIIEEAKNREGEWYGLGKSVRALLRRFRLQICTHYIIDSIIIGTGLDLTGGTGEFVTSPDELVKSSFLQKIEI